MSREPLLTVGPPPHWRSRSSITKTNFAFVLLLGPAAIAGAIAYGFGPDAAARYGPGSAMLSLTARLMQELGVPPPVLSFFGALGVLALGVGTGMLFEYAVQILFRQPYHVTNGHGALMGLVMAVLMPPTVPWWVLVIGVAITIVVGKQIFGGIGGYPMHPAIVGWLIILLSWQHHIYPVGMESIAAQHWVAIFFTFLGGVALIALGHARWQIPVGVIAGVAASAAIFHLAVPDLAQDMTWWQGAWQEIITGHVILAAFFIATDSTSSPANKAAVWIYAVAAGALIMLIRVYGVWPDAVPFAILLVNILNPLLDRVRPRVREVSVQNA